MLSFPVAGACQCGTADPLQSIEVIVRASDPEITFLPTPVDGEANKSLFLYSEGNARAELDGPLVLEDPDDVFSLTFEGEFPITAGTFTSIDARFSPRRAGTYRGTLSIPIALPGTPLSVPLVGVAEPADVELSPETLDFGEIEAGLTSTQLVTVTNLADAATVVPLQIEGRGFLVDGSARFDLALQAGEVRELEVRFLPDRGGAFDATLRAETCGASCGPATTLSGTGLAPRIDVSPRPIAFGEVPAGSSNTIEVTIVNDGIGNLQIDEVALNDPSGAIEVGNPPALPALLSGEDTLSFFLTYAPTIPDGAFDATLIIDSSDPLQGRVTVPITGTTPGAALRLLPEAANFGLIEPGGSRTLELVAVAVGTVPVTIDTIGLVGEAFAFDGPPPLLPITLQPSQSLQLPVVGTASPWVVANGGAEGTLTLAAGDLAETSNLAFTSGDQGCQPRAVVANVDLGFLRIGDGASGSHVVENVGTAACTGGRVLPAVGLPFDPGFDWQDFGVDTLEPGGVGTIEVAYTASAEGQSRAFFALDFDEREAPLLLSATATGRFGTMTPQPAGAEFGPGVVGCGTQRRTFSFVNDGQTEIIVSGVQLQQESDAFDFSHDGTPVTVAPGGAFGVRVTALNEDAGLHANQIVVDTLEVGEVTAWLTSEVLPPNTPVSETFYVPEGEARVDILFVVDNSGSMYDDQQRLADNFERFLDSATTPGASNDFHIGVTSTDVLSPDGLDGRLVSNPTYLTPSTNNLEQTFADHVSLGVDGTGLELGLEAMRLALSRPLSTGHNGGFLREEAALSVIVVSDEDDGSSDPFVPPEHVRSVDDYVAFLSAVKGGVITETPILFSAVVHPQGSPRYLEMVDAFGGVTLDINSPTWGEQLGQIGSATFGISARFRLSNPTKVDDIEITVDGMPVTNFALDATGQTLLLEVPPVPGAVVEVTFVPDC